MTIRDMLIETFGTETPTPEMVDREARREFAERARIRGAGAADGAGDGAEDEALPRHLREQLRALTRPARRSGDR
jgi:hypothetical protein